VCRADPCGPVATQVLGGRVPKLSPLTDTDAEEMIKGVRAACRPRDVTPLLLTSTEIFGGRAFPNPLLPCPDSEDDGNTAWIGGGSSVKLRLIIVQLVRRDTNPLFRGVDRAEAVVMTMLVVVSVVAWVVVAILAGRWADHETLAAEHAERGVHPVWARQLESGAEAASSPELGMAWVPAEWKLPDGREGHGQIPVALNSTSGQQTEIFINAQGQEVRPPLDAADVHDQVAFTVFSVTMGFGVVFAISYGCVRLLFDRRRMAGWQRDWDAVGPTWLRQGG
jgi:hypothetical protein